MIISIGIDIVDINRMQANLDKLGLRFAEKILSPNEYQEFLSIKKPAHFLAKRFAVKESLLKAVGKGFRDGLGFHDIEVKHDSYGKPFLECYGNVSDFLNKLEVSHTHLTIADEQDYAVAFVILEKI
jgi:holo-[acyl-carrier protein] synthase